MILIIIKFLHYLAIVFAGGVLVGGGVIQSVYTRANQIPDTHVSRILKLLGYFGLISLIILFGICYLLIGFSNKKQIENNSYKITKKSQDKIQALQEGLGAIKDVLLGGNQEYNAKIYSIISK